jgi:hypothetical protein
MMKRPKIVQQTTKLPDPPPVATPSQFVAPVDSGAPPRATGNVSFAERIPALAFTRAQRQGRRPGAAY